jgi:lipopolysaccharide transport system permease protein
VTMPSARSAPSDRPWLPTARLAELWSYRHLIGNLVRRDLKVRYKNSVLGFLWSLVSPLLMMLVFWVVFDRFLGRGTENYHAFVLVALLPWNWFSVSMGNGTHSIVANGALIKKVYFPREVLPISVVTGELVNFLLALPVLIVILLLSGIPLRASVLWVPVIIAVQATFTIGMVLFLATANVYYRDTSVILEVVLLAWFFVTPIIYPIESLRGTVVHLAGVAMSAERLVYIVNPMASIIAGYRVALYGSVETPVPGAPAVDFLVRTAVTAVVVLAIGYWVFARHSGRFGEEV